MYVITYDYTVLSSLHQTRASLRETERTCREVGEKLQVIQLAKSTIESELAVEKQWRISLQVSIAIFVCVRACVCARCVSILVLN